ncbi:MAG: aconitate hydratase 1 [Betaproteobacteria bacterium RIFCSPLOWO2_12_FULL_62_58]|nr:MAG: aconitate hydratase 1 [Betaproteobacteria bacterium RIFCSPLOWO2_12_FULL_62_58]
MPHNLFNSLKEFQLASGRSGKYYALSALEAAGLGRVSRMPYSLRVVLESLLRNCDGKRVSEHNVRELAAWQPNAPRTEEIPFVVARIVLQNLAGFPALADFAAMRGAARRLGGDPKRIEPLVPVDLVVDHSVQVDHYNSPDALRLNMEIEFQRNAERYRFLKWGMQAFDTMKIVPPGIGIVHQVNLEYLARGVRQKDGVYYPDSLVGTDSHFTMINGIGVVGWGVGGIEAEAGMLGQPIYILTPDVVGVHLTGQLQEGVTATDLVLTVTETLRKHKVVGKFVEYFGDGAASLAVTDRATVANMCPEYGATIGFFAVDDETLRYFRATGRSDEEVDAFTAYCKAQGIYGIPKAGQCDYSSVVEIDLSKVVPTVAGPKLPNQRIPLPGLKERFRSLMQQPAAEGGYGKGTDGIGKRLATGKPGLEVGHADVLIAAITSCTNTSNPAVLLGAGLLAKKAVERGLKVNPRVKTSLAPGSRVVNEYLRQSGLLPYLEQLGFYIVGYGCTTCMGSSGPLDSAIEDAVVKNDLIGVAVLSGNRNFEARIHQALKANFLMSPPLVVAFALAGTVDIDMSNEPIGTGKDGKPVYLKDIWPSNAEIAAVMKYANDPASFRRLYSNLAESNPLWKEVPSVGGEVFSWDAASTYIKEPPFFDGFSVQPAKPGDILGARALGVFGDSVTTDHISPIASINSNSLAGKYLLERNVKPADFSNLGMRRCNHEIMLRGTFAHVRIRNLMVPGSEGTVTVHQPSGEQTTIFEAAMRYQKEGVPLTVFAGEEYGTGSSRDWAAKGTQLLGVRAVIARGFERIHRSNLVGMGVLPCQFQGSDGVASLKIDGSETFDLLGVSGKLKPRQDVTLVIHRQDGSTQKATLTLRVDTPIEAEYLRHGGILPYVLREILAEAA